tara:strand:- start:5040 stop:5342 length:303 start_codon:yes stop_codon:yes gene_type:complete
MNKSTSFDSYLERRLSDPKLACQFIIQAIEENDSEYLKVALGEIVKAYGVSDIAVQTGLTRQTIYKMLSKTGNPTHKNLIAILDSLGLELTVRTKKKEAS